MRTTTPAEQLLDLATRVVEALEQGALPLEALERTFEDAAKAFGADKAALVRIRPTYTRWNLDQVKSGEAQADFDFIAEHHFTLQELQKIKGGKAIGSYFIFQAVNTGGAARTRNRSPRGSERLWVVGPRDDRGRHDRGRVLLLDQQGALL